MLKLKIIIPVLIASSLISCNKDHDGESENTKISGFELENMDKSIRPQDDFNSFVNGSWIKNNPVPSTESRWGSFNEVSEGNLVILKKILNNASNATDSEKGSNIQKIGDFYATATDSISLNTQGISGIQSELDLINSISNKKSLFSTIGKLNKIDVGGFFGLYVGQNSKKNDEHICYLYQSGLSLPDRDYYLSDKEPYTTYQTKYKEHISEMLLFLGEENTALQAESIYDLESKFAKISMDRVTRRNPDTTYNKMSVDDLKSLNTQINWDEYLAELNLGEFDSLIVSQPYFYTASVKLLKKTSIDTWKSFLKWKLIHSSASYMSDEISLASFNFYGGVLRGSKEQKPRWKRAASVVGGNMGEILGQEYVKVAFSEEAKKEIYEMVDNLQDAYAERIKGLEWMSEETKEKALLKLSTFTRKLAFPDKWKDYSALNIERDSYVKNTFRCREWSNNFMFAKLGKPIDDTEWGMSPQTVNAYYSPLKNEIVFPAGIMQPPFYNPNADAAVNYGGIGAVIGHELSHGFDDQGSKYDSEGNLKEWWTEDDKVKFEERTDRLRNQFDKFFVLDSIHVNGSLTMGENIADLGGSTMAYYAYQKYLEKNGREDIDGYTPEQRFFIGWAQVWRMNYTDQELMRRIKTDPHSPGMFRANGPLQNLPEFYAAWDVKPGDKMYATDSVRVSIW